jgi:hypothetical protein
MHLETTKPVNSKAVEKLGLKLHTMYIQKAKPTLENLPSISI